MYNIYNIHFELIYPLSNRALNIATSIYVRAFVTKSMYVCCILIVLNVNSFVAYTHVVVLLYVRLHIVAREYCHIII